MQVMVFQVNGNVSCLILLLVLLKDLDHRQNLLFAKNHVKLCSQTTTHSHTGHSEQPRKG